MTSILVDTSYIVALNSTNDKFHKRAMQFASTTNDEILFPEVVLTEVTYLLHREGGAPALLNFVNRLRHSNAGFISVEHTDVQRIYEILEQYRDADLDFVDCCLMAIAERMNITRICTFDRRDFVIFRPAHCEYLTLLP